MSRSVAKVRARVMPPRGPSYEVHLDRAVSLYEAWWGLDAEADRWSLDHLGFAGTASWDTGTNLILTANVVGVDPSTTSDLRVRNYSVQNFEASFLKERPLLVIEREGLGGVTRSTYFSGMPEDVLRRLDVLDVMRS